MELWWNVFWSIKRFDLLLFTPRRRRHLSHFEQETTLIFSLPLDIRQSEHQTHKSGFQQYLKKTFTGKYSPQGNVTHASLHSVVISFLWWNYIFCFKLFVVESWFARSILGDTQICELVKFCPCFVLLVLPDSEKDICSFKLLVMVSLILGDTSKQLLAQMFECEILLNIGGRADEQYLVCIRFWALKVFDIMIFDIMNSCTIWELSMHKYYNSSRYKLLLLLSSLDIDGYCFRKDCMKYMKIKLCLKSDNVVEAKYCCRYQLENRNGTL